MGLFFVSKLNTVQKAIAVTMLLLAIGGAVYAIAPSSSSESPSPPEGIQAIPVEPVKAELKEVRSVLVLSAQVQPAKVATLSAQVPAAVSVRVRELGDPVRASEAVLRLDDRLIQTQLRRAESAFDQARAAQWQAGSERDRLAVEVAQIESRTSAQVEEAAAQLRKSDSGARQQELAAAAAAAAAAQAEERQAQQDWDRSRRLQAEGAISSQAEERQRTAWEGAQGRRIAAEQALSVALEGPRQEDKQIVKARLRQAESELTMAQAGPLRLEAAQAQVQSLAAQARLQQHSVQEARVLLDRHVIRAPFSGRVLAVYVQAGDLVQPGTPVARIGDLTQLKLTLGLPESARKSVKLGQLLNVTIDGQRAQARVSRMGYEADSKTHTFPVELLVNNKDEHLFPNMLARVEVPLEGRERQLLLPLSCLSSDGSGHFVYVVDGGTASRRDVRLGEAQGELVRVVDGLKGGETLAAHPQRLLEGSKVVLP